jgi:hypothetical protein
MDIETGDKLLYCVKKGGRLKNNFPRHDEENTDVFLKTRRRIDQGCLIKVFGGV